MPSAPASPPARQWRALEALGIEVWMRRELPPVAADRVAPPDAAEVPAAVDSGADAAWSTLEAEATACLRCRLHEGRTHVVFGTGNRTADWMIIGEAPGAEEDRQGEPFVGRAGQLLNEMLAAIGLSRDRVYIANILKCRPPDNRDPKPDEAAACAAFLNRQIELVRPRVILAVGRVAAQNLLGDPAPAGRLRGRVRRHGASGTPVVVTWHPAYLLRTPARKRDAWADLRLARDTAALPADDGPATDT